MKTYSDSFALYKHNLNTYTRPYTVIKSRCTNEKNRRERSRYFSVHRWPQPLRNHKELAKWTLFDISLADARTTYNSFKHGDWFIHDGVIKWKHFPRYRPFVRGIHRSGEFPTQRPVTRSFDVFFDLRLNERLSKQSWGWWFETLSCPLWRHRNVMKQHWTQHSKLQINWSLVFNSIIGSPTS